VKRPKVGGGAKRSEIVTIRLDPTLRYAAEIASRTQRRTVSSLVEVAVAAYLETLDIELPGEQKSPLPLMRLVQSLWDPEESDRFVALAERCRWLLTSDEDHRWKAIREHFKAPEHLTADQRKALRPLYDRIKEKVAGALDEKEAARFPKH